MINFCFFFSFLRAPVLNCVFVCVLAHNHFDSLSISQVIPKLQAYLTKQSETPDEWNQQTWEDLLLKLLSRTLDVIASEVLCVYVCVCVCVCCVYVRLFVYYVLLCVCVH
jgi:hypothetical protein